MVSKAAANDLMEVPAGLGIGWHGQALFGIKITATCFGCALFYFLFVFEISNAPDVVCLAAQDRQSHPADHRCALLWLYLIQSSAGES